MASSNYTILLISLALAILNARVEAAGSVLELNTSLGVGEFIESQDGRFTLTLEATGNLELRYFQEKIWESDTSGSGATSAEFQTDGNFVLFTDGTGGTPRKRDQPTCRTPRWSLRPRSP